MPKPPCNSISGGDTGGCTRPGCGQPVGSSDNDPCKDDDPEGDITVITKGRPCSNYCDEYYKANGEDDAFWGCSKNNRCNTKCEHCPFLGSGCEQMTGHCDCDNKSAPACQTCNSRSGYYENSSGPCFRRFCKKFICLCNGKRTGSPFDVCVDHNIREYSSPNSKLWAKASKYCEEADLCKEPEDFCKKPINTGDTNCDCYTYYDSLPACPSGRSCYNQGSATVHLQSGDRTAFFRKECTKGQPVCNLPPTDLNYRPCGDCEVCTNDGCVRDTTCDGDICPVVCGTNCCKTSGDCVIMTRYTVADTCHNQGFSFCTSGSFESQFVSYIPTANAVCSRGHIHTDIYGYNSLGEYQYMGRNLDGAAQPYKTGTCGESCPPSN